jgi:hypothetical protein
MQALTITGGKGFRKEVLPGIKEPPLRLQLAAKAIKGLVFSYSKGAVEARP